MDTDPIEVPEGCEDCEHCAACLKLGNGFPCWTQDGIGYDKPEEDLKNADSHNMD